VTLTLDDAPVLSRNVRDRHGAGDDAGRAERGASSPALYVE
jgi:hypothetical protein